MLHDARSGVAGVPRHRAHPRRAVAHLSRRGRGLPPLPGRRVAGGRAPGRAGQRDAHAGRRPAARGRAAGPWCAPSPALEPAQRRRRPAGLLPRGRGDGARGRGRPGRVGALPRHARHRPRRPDVRHEARRHRRPTGRGQRRRPRRGAGRARGRGRHRAHRRAGRLGPLRGRAGAGRRAGRRHRGRGADRGLGLRSSRHLRRAGCATRRRRRRRCIDRWQSAPTRRRLRVQGRCRHRHPADLQRSITLPDRLGFEPLHATTIVAPPLDEMAARPPADGATAGWRSGRCSSPTSRRSSTRACRSTDGHVFSLETLYTPYALQGGWTAARSPQRWLEVYGSASPRASSTVSNAGGR